MSIHCEMDPSRDAAANADIKRGAPFRPSRKGKQVESGVCSDKRCTKCGQSGCRFWRSKSEKDGLDYYCTVCRNLTTLQWRKADPKRVERHRRAGLAYYYARKARQGERQGATD